MLGLYLLALVIGLGWTVVNFALGHGGGDAGGEVHAGGSFGADGGEGGFGEAVGEHGGGPVALPLFSPTAIAGYLTGFGATGLGLHAGLGIETPLIHVPVALLGAAVLGVGVAWITVKVLALGEISSAEGPESLVGRSGEITVAIPAGGVGEIAFLSGGRRNAGAARAVGGAAIPAGSRVRIVRLEGSTYLVEPEGEPVLPELPPRRP
jgi:membrane protein implicated in regulation of membrane protease activity